MCEVLCARACVCVFCACCNYCICERVWLVSMWG
jgi:hypothetical protein